MSERIYPGGLKRCCLATLERALDRKADTPCAGDKIVCASCGVSEFWRGGGWYLDVEFGGWNYSADRSRKAAFGRPYSSVK